ncbi:MAG: hypothetical protein JXM73_03960, partial [Anaerolineae bacterium]|nr:hypothetical protein [Anaerolineae bacterium]
MTYLTETRAAPVITIRRERLLPTRGEVLARPGEQVGPADVVARCQLPGSTQVVDVSRTLGVRRERVDRYMAKSVGDAVQAGETLASHSGLLGRLKPICRSPVGGQVVAVRDGLVLIEAAPSAFELRAHLKGQVASVMPGLGVVISTTGALIQGMWGSGGEAQGILKVLVDSPRKPLRARAIDVSCHGTIVAGGNGLDDKALEQAVAAQVLGIIVGSINASLRPLLKTLPFPVIITEGFGSYPMSQAIFSLLQSNAGREAMMSADTQFRWGARRPEIVIPVHGEEAAAVEDQGAFDLQ